MGELCVRGPWVIDGTGRAPAAAVHRRRLVQDGRHSGRVAGRLLRDRDRIKDLIKSGGEWISSVDLEADIMAMAEVAEAVVVAMPDPRWQERPLAFIVPKQASTVTLEQVRHHLEERGWHDGSSPTASRSSTPFRAPAWASSTRTAPGPDRDRPGGSDRHISPGPGTIETTTFTVPWPEVSSSSSAWVAPSRSDSWACSETAGPWPLRVSLSRRSLAAPLRSLRAARHSEHRFSLRDDVVPELSSKNSRPAQGPPASSRTAAPSRALRFGCRTVGRTLGLSGNPRRRRRPEGLRALSFRRFSPL